MKIHFKISESFFLFFVVLCNSSFVFAQKVQTGIYEVVYNTDTTFLHQNIPKLIPENRDNDLKFVYQYNYSNFIDKEFDIKYAVVIKNQDPKNPEKYNLEMIWLNNVVPNPYPVSYSDSIVRKFIQFNYDVHKPFDEPYRDYSKFNVTLNQYLKYRNPKNEYIDEYQSKFDYNTFFVKNNTFFLKSYHYHPVIYSLKVDSTSYYNNPLGGSGYKKAIKYVTINQPIVAFKLKTIKKYKSYLPIQKDSVKFYIDSNKTIKILNSGDFISVTKETDEWYFGEQISTDGEVTAGKIFIDDLSDSKTKTITKNGLSIKVKYSLFEENQGWNQLGVISGIKTYYKGKLIQVIKNPGFVSDTLTVLDFEDVNFDGFRDLVIFSHDGGAGPNYGNNYYIFNSKTKQFVFNKTMSDLSQPEVDSKTRTIYAAWRNGAGNHGSEKYKWIKNKLIMVEYYETNYLSEDKVSETHEFLIKGKMRGKTKIVNESQLKTPF